ncbi:MAG: T9SS type A sorting domain-containing protein [Ferruginibacter sp.]
MKKYYCLATMLICLHTAFGQQAFNSAGSAGLAGNFGLDWSVGELTLVKTEQNGALMFTQGVLQGNIMVFSGSSSITDGEIKILPNPTPGILYIQTGFLQPGKLSTMLFSVQGQKIINREETLNGFSVKNINMTSYAAGTYFLEMVFADNAGNSRKRTYKIVKL